MKVSGLFLNESCETCRGLEEKGLRRGSST